MIILRNRKWQIAFLVVSGIVAARRGRQTKAMFQRYNEFDRENNFVAVPAPEGQGGKALAWARKQIFPGQDWDEIAPADLATLLPSEELPG